MKGVVLTLGDYIKESLEFENSTEYYKLQKECLELELLSLDYIIESSNDLSGYLLDDAILFNLNESPLITESVGERIKLLSDKLIKKIGDMWSMIIKSLKIFFKNVINIFTNEQNKKIKELEGLKEINKLNEEEITKLKTELADIMDKLVDSKRANTILKNEKSLLKYDLKSANSKIDKLDKDILKLLDDKHQAVLKLMPIMQKLKSENINVELPESIHRFGDFVIRLRHIITDAGGTKENNLKYSFALSIVNLMAGLKIVPNADSIIYEKIDTINKLINDIKESNNKKVMSDLSIKQLKDTMYIIDNYLQGVLDFTKGNEDGDQALRGNRTLEWADGIIKNKPKLFSDYLTANMELSATFKTLSADVVRHVKQYVDDRSWAIGAYLDIQSVINKFNNTGTRFFK